MKGIVCAFEGRLAHDARVKHTNAGKQFLQFGVINGEGDERQWLHVVAWSEGLVDIVGYLKAGVEVYVEGKLKTKIWLNDGEPSVSLSVSASKVEPLALIGRGKPKAARAPSKRAGKVDSQRPIEPAPFSDSLDDVFPGG